MGNIITWEGKQYEQVESSDSEKCNLCAFSDENCNVIEAAVCGNPCACLGKWYYKEVKEEKVIDEEAEKQRLADEILDYVNKHYPEKKPECSHDCSTCKHTYEKKEVDFIPGKVYKDCYGSLVLCTDSKGSCKDYFTGYLITDDPTQYDLFSGCWGGWVKSFFTPVELVEKK